MEKDETKIKDEAESWAAKAFYIICAGCFAFMLAAYIFAFN